MFERYENLSFTREGRVLTIVLDNPATLNAVSHALHRELAQVFYDAADDPDSDVIILTGAGEAFSAGGDLKWMREQVEGDPEPFVVTSRDVRRIVHGLLDCPKPIIARVNGPAIGLGASLALLCDIVIAVETATFADPHVRVGLVPGDGGALIWPQLIGFAKAKHYLFTGDAIRAKEAEQMNLITFAVAADDFDAFVRNYAEKLARGAQTPIRYTKVATNIALRQLFDSVFEVGLAYEGLSRHSFEFREGVAAMQERRRPDFRRA